MSSGSFFQAGVVVADIDAAMSELTTATGVTWTEPAVRRLGEHAIRVAHSVQGPPYIELIEATPGSPWFHENAPVVDHLAFWRDDIDAERERLIEAGFAIAVDGQQIDRPMMCYFTSNGGFRVEHLASAARPDLESSIAGRPRIASRARQTIDAYFDGINREEYDEVGSLFGSCGILIAPGTKPLCGSTEVASYFRAALAPYPEHRDEPGRVFEAGNTVVVEIAFRGTTALGGTVMFDAVDVFDIDQGERIVRLTSWYDSHAVRKRLRELRSTGEG